MKRTLRILLVDDSDTDRDAVRGALSGRPSTFRLTEADTVRSALAYLERRAFDCALVDFRLPDGDAFDFLEKAKTAPWGTTPIVVFTGVEDEGLCARLLQDGAQDYLLKSEATGPALDRAIRYAVERRRGQLEVRQTSHRLRQAQRLESVGSLARGVAHEFNNILMVILGLSELMLEETSADDPTREDLTEIVDACNRGSTLTGQLLAFARTDMGTPAILSTAELVNSVQALLRRIIGADIELIVTQEPGLHSVRADRTQLEQLLVNLCVNAREAMPRGGVLRIETRNVLMDSAAVADVEGLRPGRYVSIVVTDTGQGMTPDVRARAFDPFFTTKAHRRSAGLGLSTAYGIARQSGGNIELSSAPGKGTAARVLLPAVDTPRRARRAQIERDSSAVVPNQTVLLVEDERAVRELASRVLRAHGLDVLEATDGADALRVAAQNAGRPFDLVVTDCVMPGIGGPQLVRELLETRPELRVIFMSGYTETPTLQELLASPRITFLRKPFTTKRLMSAVEEVFA